MTENTICKFCNEYQLWIKGDEFHNECYKQNGDQPRYREYTVAIVRRSWTKQIGKRGALTATYYRKRGVGFALNYCPECGTKLERREGK